MLSIDLPAHGERRGRGEELVPWTAAPDVRAAWEWAERRWNVVSLRANSIGAYFAMLAVDRPARALLVSPILDMEELILTMIGWAGVTEEELRERGEIAAPPVRPYPGSTCAGAEHPVRTWNCPVRILYGSGDNMTPRRTVEEYVRRHGARLTVLEGGEHWLHTPEQLSALREWEERES